MMREEAVTLCMQHQHRYVGVHTADGMFHDGIVEHVDEENLYLAVPIGCEGEDSRAFIGGPFWGGYPAYGYGYPYGYGFFPRRRFYRRVLPLAGLLALSLLPYY
jgi:hypothetical protein